MTKIFYDTNILLQNLEELKKRTDIFYISNITIVEIDSIKESSYKSEDLKYRARKASAWLNENIDCGKCKIILFKEKYWLKYGKFHSLEKTPDAKIVCCAKACFKFKKKKNTLFCTADRNCRELAAALKLNTQYCYEKIENDDYTGFKEIILDEAEMVKFYATSLQEHKNEFDLLENQYLVIKDTSNKVVDYYKWKNSLYTKVPYIKAESSFFGKVGALDGDIYQRLALDALATNKISMIRGAAGTGKSYLAFAYMFSLLEKGKIDKIITFCNTVATKGSAKLGYYPGSRTEKLLDSQIGNFLSSKLGDRTIVEEMIEKGKLLLLPMSDIRGFDTSKMNAAIYITEAQNLDIELMKLALTRIGDDSICILDGDSNAQVDLSMYEGSNNGMRRVSQIFRGDSEYGEITLQNIKRSHIAELAQKL